MLWRPTSGRGHRRCSVVCVAAYQANEELPAPLALALFIIVLVRPFGILFKARMPALLVLAITMTLTVAVCIPLFALLVGWAFGRVGVSSFA